MNDSMKSALYFSASWLGISAVAAVPFKAQAQDQAEETVVEEMVVTARKRAQSIQDVPLAIQAFDTQPLREKGLRDFEDYARELTSVSFGTSSPGATTIAFRGALAQPTGFDTISSSILYLDEIPITRDGQNPDVRLIDIERLEALSGPQPTVYGAGSQSGTLKIVTAKPNTEALEGWIEAGIGDTKDGEASYSISGAINVPIVEDKLAVRLVGFYDAEGGFIDNVLGTTSFYSEFSGDRDNAEFVEDDINDYDVYGARAIVRYEPNENWSIEAGLIYQSATLDGLFDFNPAAGDLDTIKFKDEKREDDWYNAALTIEGDLGFATLTMAGGYHSRNIDYDVDSTAYMTAYRDAGLARNEYYLGSASFSSDCFVSYYDYDFCFVNYNDFGPNPTGQLQLDQRVRSYVQEIRLTSNDDGGRFSWLVGAFYERTNNDWDYISRVDDFAQFGGGGTVFAYYGTEPSNIWFDQGFTPDALFGVDQQLGSDVNGYEGDLESIAVFGEVSFEITDQLTISAGGRWFSTDFQIATLTNFVGSAQQEDFDNTTNTKDFNPRVNLTYEPNDDLLMYFTFSQGARIGGVNVLRTPIARAELPETFQSDVLTNYEIGVKSSWLDGRLIANLTGFMMNWKDFQLQSGVFLSNGFPTTADVNVANASNDGIEGQFAFQATEKLEFTTAFTYLSATIDGPVVFPTGDTSGEAGDDLPATPNWQLSASMQYTTPLPWKDELEAYFRFDASHTGNSVNGIPASVVLFAANQTPVQEQPAYQIGDVSFGVRSPGDWEVWLSVNNVWDERAITYIWPRFSDGRSFTVRPREIRLGLYKQF